MKPNSIRWAAPKYVKQSEQDKYNALHNWRGMSFFVLTGNRFYWLEGHKRFPRTPVWNIGSEVFDSVSKQNATIVSVHGTNQREGTFIFNIMLEDGSIVRRSSSKLDIAF